MTQQFHLCFSELGFIGTAHFVSPIFRRNNASRDRMGKKDQKVLFRRKRKNFVGQSRRIQTSGDDSIKFHCL